MALLLVFSVLTCAVLGVFSEEPMALYTNERMPESKIVELHEAQCTEDFGSFCLHGHCTVLESLGEPICRCDFGFTGERCEQLILAAKMVQEPDATQFPIWIGLGLLITGLVIFIWSCKKARCKKSAHGQVRCNTEEALSQVNVLE